MTRDEILYIIFTSIPDTPAPYLLTTACLAVGCWLCREITRD